jgi:prolyl oligopeptidase
MLARLGIVLAIVLGNGACSQPAARKQPAATQASVAAPAAAPAALVYPASKTVAQTDTYHGVAVNDPYRWLENVDGADSAAWIAAQNKLTFDYLGRIADRDRIKQRLTELWNFERSSPPTRYGDRYFFARNDGLQNQSVIYVSESLQAAPRVLIDPNALSKDGTIAVTAGVPSEGGKLYAYETSVAGSDWTEVHVLDVASGKRLNDELKWVKFSNLSWRRNASGFYYSRYDEPKGENTLKAANKFHKLYFHRLGAAQSADKLIYERKDQPDWLLSANVSEDGRYLVIDIHRGTETSNLLLVHDLSKKDAKPVELIGQWSAEFDYLGNDKSQFYLRTDADATRGRIVRVDLKHPDKAHWHEIVPQAVETLQSATLVDHSFIASYLKDAHSEIRRLDLKGKRLSTLELPGVGTAAGFAGRSTDKETFYTYASYTTPASIYRWDLTGGTSSVFRVPKLAFDPSRFETRQVFYQTKDGTRVPLMISSRKGLKLDGDNPTILYGYGGFNIPSVPAFSVPAMTWMDMGGIFAVANLRGGGEYGREWHEAGMKLRKQNVFDDFIAAAEYLIAQKYTKPQKLAIRGGSNGGLLVAAVELQRPELFAAAIPAVGVLDMLRFREFTIGKAWESDYGSVDSADEFKALYAYSPLHNIKKGTKYPPTLILTGDHDDRVFPAHSFKFAAALQAADPTGAPHLIRIETRAGHGAGKPTTKQIQENADVYAFIRQAMGISVP